MQGIVIAALGYNIYGEMALNLAVSLRVVSPNIDIALLYDDDGISTLKENHLSLFNQLIKVGGGEVTVADSKHYQFAKLLVHKYSPFDFTIYIDADTLWGHKPIEKLFEQFKEKDFFVGAHAIYTQNDQRLDAMGYTHWCRPYEACVYHNLDYIQQTVSGLFYFRKTPIVKEIFNHAQKVYLDPNTPHYVWANGKPDEYCFNVALSKLGIKIERNCLIYFDKLCGIKNEDAMFNEYYGIAIGGNKIRYDLKTIYNRKVKENSIKYRIEGFEAVEKYVVIESRNNEKNAVSL